MKHKGRELLAGLVVLLGSSALSAAEFRLSGLEDPLAANVRAMLTIDDALEKETLPRPGRLNYLHRQSEAEIRQALQPFGYYNPELNLELSVTGPEESWFAAYEVNPGPRTVIGKLHLALDGVGQDDEELQRVLADSALKEGAPFLHQDYSALKSQLQSRASERGYYDADFTTSSVQVFPETNRAEIELVYHTGSRVSIGDIRFDEAPVSEKLLRRYLPFESGDPVDTAQLVTLQRNLIDSNYFGDVEVRPLLDQREGGMVPIHIGLGPRKQTLYSGGAGYGTDTGARIQLGMTRRWLNTRGHSLDTRLRMSEIKQEFYTTYLIPGSNPVTDRFALTLRLEDEDSDTIDARTVGIGGSWQKQFANWERVLGLEWQQEEWIFEGEQRDSTLLLPSARFSRTKADDLLNTSKGYSLELGVQAASEALLSDTDLIQFDMRTKRVDSFAERWRLLTRAELGITLVDAVDDLPASLRFYAGGDSSVRGYDYQSLGPEGKDGDVIGGRYLAAASVEVDYLVKDKWRVAAFFDAGNAFDDKDVDLKTGAGVGARWLSPIGPIRLDLAVPLEDSGVRLHFTLGPDL